MSAFEFFFSFYGLLLGLTLAAVVSRVMLVFSRRESLRWLHPAVRDRKQHQGYRPTVAICVARHSVAGISFRYLVEETSK